MIFKFYNRTFLGGYHLSYINNKQNSKCKYEYRTWKYGEWIDIELL